MPSTNEDDMTYAQQRAFDKSYTESLAAEIRLFRLLAKIRAAMKAA